MSEVITPTVGRIVWYFPPHTTVPWPAIIVAVHSDALVDVCHFTPGGCYPRTSVLLVQPGVTAPANDLGRCEWMPYQVKKTTGSESGEKAAGTEAI